ncbi:MAG: hypothetical protein Q8M26_12075 [Pseudolabrys sp.]|nr:hypothetical protein [Pseudolabrys sp.]
MINILSGSTLLALAVGLFIFATPEEGKPHRFVTSPTLTAFMPGIVMCIGIAGLVVLARALFR